MTDRRKIALITGGGDWYDASAALLAVPEGRDFDADVKAYPGYRECKLFLVGWLKERGYEEPTEDEVVETHT